MAACLSNELASGFVSGALPAGTAEEVERHIDGCAACRELVAALARQDVALGPGVLLADRYRIAERLGSGGMGVVYTAVDETLGRKVALKLLRPELATPAHEERLRREAQAMARASHPQVVTVHDVARAGGRVVLAMELIDGVTLRRWLRERPRRTGEILEVFMQAARGLAAAHGAGLVHRDFKPENVLVGRDGRVCVSDFGLARLGSGGHEAPGADLPVTATQTGSLVGTPAYMAPEQLMGEEATAASDQFAFCVALFEALHGERPFAGDTLGELADAVVHDRRRALHLRRIPEGLRRALDRGLASAPQARHPGMLALLAAIDPRPARRRRRAWLLAGAAAALLVAGGVVTLALTGPPPPPPVCEGGVRDLDGVWDQARRQAGHAAFAASGRPYAEKAWSEAQARLDGTSRAWVAMQREVCLASRVRHEESDTVHDRRMLCLHRRLAELAAVGELFARADAQVVDRSAALAASVGSLDRCASLEILASRLEPPASPELGGQVEAVRAQLARAAALQQAARMAPGLELATQAVTQARALGYRPLEAEALLTQGRLEDGSGKPAAARATLEAAVWAAEASGHDEVAAQAWAALVNVVGRGLGQTDEAERLLPRASAALERAGHRADLEVRYLRALGNLRLKEARPREALAAFDQAAALVEKQDPRDPALANLVNAAGNALEKLGDYAGARAHYQRARALQEGLLGADHPDVATTLENLGIIASIEGSHEEALRLFQTAQPIMAAALGPRHPRTAEADDEIGQELRMLGRFDEAAPYLERAVASAEGQPSAVLARYLQGLAVLERLRHHFDRALELSARALEMKQAVLGDDHPELADGLVSRALLLEDLGRWREADKLLARALAIYEASRGPEHESVGNALVNLSQVALHLGQARRAEETARRGLAVYLVAYGADHLRTAVARVALGKALLARHQTQAGRAELEQAIGRLEQEGEPAAGDLAEARAALH